MGGLVMATSNLGEIIPHVESQYKERCSKCPLKEMDRLIFPLEKEVRKMLVTEGPGEKRGKQLPINKDHVVSILNKTLYPYLYTLFGGRFEPRGPQANVYWTHARKCVLNGKGREEKKALRICRESYLGAEIRSVRPQVVLAVGQEAFEFFAGHDNRLEGNYLDVFTRQTNDIFRNVKIDDVAFDLALAPHPSGLNRFWNWKIVTPDTAFKIFGVIRTALSTLDLG
jgi:hypothetical protein